MRKFKIFILIFKFSVNVCVANLPDLIIDYPNAKLYANEMIEKSYSYKVMT